MSSPRPANAPPAQNKLLLRVGGQPTSLSPPGSPAASDTLPPLPYHLDRSYQFLFLPNGLFSRLLVRLLHLTNPLTIWANGIVADFPLSRTKTRFFVEQVALSPTLSASGGNNPANTSSPDRRTSAVDRVLTSLVLSPSLSLPTSPISLTLPTLGSPRPAFQHRCPSSL